MDLLHHIELNVSDLVQSRKFYEILFAELDYGVFQEWPAGFSFKSGETYFVFVQTEKQFLHTPYHRKMTGLNHLAFYAKSCTQVDAITEKMKGLGVRILYEADHPYAGGPEHYAVFMEDPDRIKIEVVAGKED